MVEMAKLIDNTVSQKPRYCDNSSDAAALGKSVKAVSCWYTSYFNEPGSDDYASLELALTLDKLSLKLVWWWTK